jgi:hypothetical protein
MVLLTDTGSEDKRSGVCHLKNLGSVTTELFTNGLNIDIMYERFGGTDVEVETI